MQNRTLDLGGVRCSEQPFRFGIVAPLLQISRRLPVLPTFAAFASVLSVATYFCCLE
jgi:hypothetical protein